MPTQPRCLECLLRLARTTLERLGAAPELQRRLLRQVLELLARADHGQAPPFITRRIFELLQRELDDPDPFAEIKRRSNRQVLALLPGLRRRAQASPDPFRTAAKLALAGNIIDYGVPASASHDLEQTIERVLGQEPALDQLDLLRRRALAAERILYLADNAGEIALDRLLIEQLPDPGRVVLAVRGGPALNDATRDDARQVGLDGMVQVIDSGVAMPATCPEQSSPELRRELERAGLIIAKGQGNFETLHVPSLRERPVFFLFMVKCAVVAELTGFAEGSALAGFSEALGC
jgi:hypothetical protein